MSPEFAVYLHKWEQSIKDDLDYLQGMLEKKEREMLDIISLKMIMNGTLNSMEKLQPTVIITDGSEGLVGDEETVD